MDILLALLCISLLLGYARAQGSALRVTQIDDSDVCTPLNPTGIQYSAGWWSRPDVGRYLNTLTLTGTQYASAVFFFKGNYIGYYADIWSDHTIAYVSIDGLPPATVPSFGTNTAQQLLWSVGDLAERDHQLIVSHGGASSTSQLWITLDFLIIKHNGSMHTSMLGPGATSAPSEFLIDDKHDHIIYEGSWSATQSFYYGGFQSTTTTPGASLTFAFNGTAVYYFSDRHARNGWALISVDGGEGELVSTFLDPGDNRWFSQVMCWSKTNLGDGPHTVKITHSDQQGKYVGLDFFKYTPSSTSVVGSSPVPSIGSVAGPKQTPLAAIVGGSVGGGVALLLAVILCYWLYHRRSRLKVYEGGETATQENGAPQHSETRDVTYHSEPWSPGSQPNSPRPMSAMSGLNERPTVQSYAASPEPQDT